MNWLLFCFFFLFCVNLTPGISLRMQRKIFSFSLSKTGNERQKKKREKKSVGECEWGRKISLCVSACERDRHVVNGVIAPFPLPPLESLLSLCDRLNGWRPCRKKAWQKWSVLLIHLSLSLCTIVVSEWLSVWVRVCVRNYEKCCSYLCAEPLRESSRIPTVALAQISKGPQRSTVANPLQEWLCDKVN